MNKIKKATLASIIGVGLVFGAHQGSFLDSIFSTNDQSSKSIIIDSSKMTLATYNNRNKVDEYPISIDMIAIPKGTFTISQKDQTIPSLMIRYPDRAAAEYGKKKGIITTMQYDMILDSIRSGSEPPQDTPLGSSIYIVGLGQSQYPIASIGLGLDSFADVYNFSNSGEKGTKVEVK